jgi:hypothetical protein
MLGIDTRADPWLAYQVRSAVYAFGTWFEARCKETREEPMPETKRKPTRTVPKYSETQLRAFLGLDGAGEFANVLASSPDLDRKAAELQAAYQRGDAGWRELLEIGT